MTMKMNVYSGIINELEKEYFEFLDTRKQQTMTEVLDLIKDDRKDESNVLKAKANIYDIFKALWNAAKNTSTDMESFKEAFLNKASAIPSAQETSLQKAREHNDTFKILIEEAKLEATSDAKEKFMEMVKQI